MRKPDYVVDADVFDAETEYILQMCQEIMKEYGIDARKYVIQIEKSIDNIKSYGIK